MLFFFITKLSSLTKSYRRHVCGMYNAAQRYYSRTMAEFFVTGKHSRTISPENSHLACRHALLAKTLLSASRIGVDAWLATRVLELAKRRWKSEIQHQSGRRGRRQRRFRPTVLVNLCRKRTTTTTTTTKSDDAERLGRPSWSRVGDGPVFI